MALLEGHDRLHYIIDEARDMEPLPEKFKTEENKIRGCVSNLWVTGKVLEDGTMQYRHDADAFVTKGTAKILITNPCVSSFLARKLRLCKESHANC